ncbi:MAG: phosphoglycerate mutase, partial [Muribaculaceae bacterium]|nr:phosphoglycerate mutase [Muribaculaceae bacterium]
ELKKTTIEYLDRRICKPVVEAIEKMDEEVTIAVLPDHPTPCRLRTHSASAVPFLICKPGEKADGVTTYSEASARDGSYGMLRRDEFMKALFE